MFPSEEEAECCVTVQRIRFIRLFPVLSSPVRTVPFPNDTHPPPKAGSEVGVGEHGVLLPHRAEAFHGVHELLVIHELQDHKWDQI